MDKTATHTPGPWRVSLSDYPHGHGTTYIRAEGDEPGKVAIAQMCKRGLFNQQDGNAKLIASAPDLAEALRFYATPHRWTRTELASRDAECASDVEQDGGDVARAALKDAGYE